VAVHTATRAYILSAYGAYVNSYGWNLSRIVVVCHGHGIGADEHAGHGIGAGEHAGHGIGADEHAGHGIGADEHAGHGIGADEHAGHGIGAGEHACHQSTTIGWNLI
jgi:hypothetical protein